MLTCLPGWRRVVCWVDNLAHSLHLSLPWLCDWHDRMVFGKDEDWALDESEEQDL